MNRAARPRHHRQRGATFIELLISIALLLTGMVALLRVIAVSQHGDATAQQFTQAHARAQQVIESMRRTPTPVLACLAATPVAGWTACEQQCLATLGAAADPGSCVFVTLSTLKTDRDSTNQAYAVVDDPLSTPAPYGDRSSWVRSTPGATRVWGAQVTIGWNESGAAPGLPFDHRVTLRTAIYR